MLYRARRPRAPLDASVEWVWACRNDRRPDALERVLPSASAQLIVNLQEDQTRVYDPDRSYRCVTSPGTVFGGARTTYQVIDSAEPMTTYAIGAQRTRLAPHLGPASVRQILRAAKLDVELAYSLWKLMPSRPECRAPAPGSRRRWRS